MREIKKKSLKLLEGRQEHETIAALHLHHVPIRWDSENLLKSNQQLKKYNTVYFHYLMNGQMKFLSTLHYIQATSLFTLLFHLPKMTILTFKH